MRRRPAPFDDRARLLAGVVVVALGCGDRPSAADDPLADTHTTEPPTEPGSSPDSRSSPSPSASPTEDPFAGIEGLRPQPWTSWPLENVDIEAEAGWRIDPVTGGYVLGQRLILAADPGAFVLAIAPGEVVELRPAPDPGSDPGPDSGAIELVIAHGHGIESRYAPVAEALVHAGLPVTRGAAIGVAAGKTLALEVRIDGVPIDPLLALRQPLHRWSAATRERPPTPARP